MQGLIEAFLIYKADNCGCADATVRSYQLSLRRFAAWLGDGDLEAVTTDQLLVFTGPYLSSELSLAPATRATVISAVREFFAWALATNRLRGNPAKALAYPRIGRPLPRVMSLAEAEKLMWSPDYATFEGVRDSAMLALMIGCGLRVSGVVSLNTSSVTRQEVDGEQRTALRLIEKGNVERIVPVPREAALLLSVYMDHPTLTEINRALPNGDQVLFVSLKNRHCPPHEHHGEKRRMHRTSILQMIQRYGQKAGIRKDVCHPHAMRHLFGTELAEGNIDLLERQQLMGHKDAKTTGIYTHLASRKLTSSIDKANPLNRINTPATALLRELGKPAPGPSVRPTGYHKA
jgi:site-specific recombinase XerD